MYQSNIHWALKYLRIEILIQKNEMNNALIFGANGQDGHYISALCKIKGIEPIGISRSGDWIYGDVSQYTQVEQLIKQYQPVFIFHLAALSSTQHKTLFENHETISTGTLNILEAVKRFCPSSKVFITGSGVQFKNTGNPISEKDEFEATSPYSIARIQSVFAARYYRSLGIRVYVGYLFHHESPLRKSNHVSKKIALAVRRIAAGSHECIEMGDISVEKEWTYAGDVAEAILVLVKQENVFEAVVGSGEPYSIEYWLKCCFDIIGKDWRDYIKLQEGFHSEYPLLFSNPALIKSMGWNPKIDIKKLARIMVFPENEQII
jgi:GDPmannose 4,6-dehydratase